MLAGVDSHIDVLGDGDRQRTDRDRAGVRVRLLGHAGDSGAARGGPARGAHQQQPRDHHDRPEHGRRHLHRAAHLRGLRSDHRERERPDVLLPTLGGQTALNLAIELSESGVLERVRRASDRCRLEGDPPRRGPQASSRDCAKRRASTRRGARWCTSVKEAMRALEVLGLPAIIRPSFTLGGSGSGMARTREELRPLVKHGLRQVAPVREVLIEESIEGWKEFELEVMRDREGNHVVVCSIENLDPMGVHTGDSVTVAPVQTLRDREYQLHARRGLQDHGRGRHLGRRERAIRPRARNRAHGRDRDEPARVAFVGAREQGHRLPDRQGGGAARARLHARRAARTTSWAPSRPPSSRRSITWWSRFRAGTSRSSTASRTRWARRCSRSAR